MSHPSKIKLKNNERQKCEIWTRIMGYFRPISVFNAGKKSEFYERRYFSEQKTVEKMNADQNSHDDTPDLPDDQDIETPRQ